MSNKNKTTILCCLCGVEIQMVVGSFHNADPVKDGFCCDACNMEHVIQRRMEIMHNGK